MRRSRPETGTSPTRTGPGTLPAPTPSLRSISRPFSMPPSGPSAGTVRDDAPGVPKCLRGRLEPSDAVLPTTPAPAGHASPAPRRLSVAAFLSEDGSAPARGDRARGGDVGRARGRSVRGGGDDRPDDPSLARNERAARRAMTKTKGTLLGASDEGASSEEAWVESGDAVPIPWCFVERRLGSTAAADTSAPDDADFAQAAAGNARWTEAAVEPMTPTLRRVRRGGGGGASGRQRRKRRKSGKKRNRTREPSGESRRRRDVLISRRHRRRGGVALRAEKGGKRKKTKEKDLERRRARSVSARRACFVCFV